MNFPRTFGPVVVLAIAAGSVGVGAVTWSSEAFSHTKHREVFPSCVTCHAGATGEDMDLWPDPQTCRSCHDGVIEEEVEWLPRETLRISNLKFSHDRHRELLNREGEESAACVDCHIEVDGDWMEVRIAAVDRCLACHEIDTEHLSAPDEECATCHITLAEATDFSEARIADFQTPESHSDDSFHAGAGHGQAAEAQNPVAASCATCHAQEFCINCHVDAPEQPVIQALGMNPRSLVHAVEPTAPETHGRTGFVFGHGVEAMADPGSCATCHTQESCFSCHVATPEVAANLHESGEGRGAGVTVQRTPPVTHDIGFRNLHADVAAANPASCAGCHAREDCLTCHLPQAGDADGFHPADFIVQHPAAAYARETSCSDCHNSGSFCASCHEAAGVVAVSGALGAGFHDGNRVFIVGHGPAARQSLESCVSCHVERDCLTCHGADNGRGFSPHGPTFDADRLARKNAEMCYACHRMIPSQP
ncbi:MAG: cytochrome c family protein [Gemmatimonadota bacterium]|nr:cytochrome c family protein [Gemmatimonadota bacterium]MDH5803863.1 cytochrome c family protein [Gemmatimonadota bacterium]